MQRGIGVETLLNNIEESVCITNLEGKVLFVNKALEEHFKYNGKELLEKYLSANVNFLKLHNAKKIAISAVINIFVEKISYRGEMAFCILFKIRGLSNKEIVVNINENEINLKAIEQTFLTDMFLSDFSAIVDKPGNFLYITEAVSNILGWQNFEMIGKNWRDFIHPEDMINVKEQEENSIAAGKTQKCIITSRVKCKNGEYRWIQWKFKPFEEPSIAYITGEDVTVHMEYKNKQLEILKTKELEKIYDNFLSVISHELRTPLTLINSTSTLIQDNIPPEKYNRFKKNINRLTRLINNLISMIELTNGKYQLKYEKIDIELLTRQILEVLERNPNFKNITIKLENNLLENFVYVDAYYIKKVILNIISNAIKHTEIDGEILIELTSSECFVDIAVTNFGRPIPKTLKENIFAPFFIIEEILTRKNDGSGIGLALSYTVAKLHEGEIVVKSDTECTCFTVRIPKGYRETSNHQEKILTDTYDNDLENDIFLELSDI